MDFDIFRDRAQHPQTNVYYAYEYIVAGLRHYCGEYAQWLPEYKQVVSWLRQNKGRGLLLIGPTGRGKSVLCRDIIPQILNTIAQSDICTVASAYTLASGFEIPPCQFLVIDDIGIEDLYSEFGTRRDRVAECVDYCERQNIVLIVTTNLTIDKLRNVYGERTLDRLRALCDLVLLTGPSFRSGVIAESNIPNIPRAYGITFETQEEADRFKQKQDTLYENYYNEVYPACQNDIREIMEHQPLKLYNGKLYALLKYDWSKSDDS